MPSHSWGIFVRPPSTAAGNGNECSVTETSYRGVPVHIICQLRLLHTNILPNADFKFFIDASIDIRAKRRLLEKNISFLHENDEKCMLQTLVKNMVERDNIDRSRENSPMEPAKDAYVIDTTSMNADQLLSIATKLIEGNLYT